MSGADHANSPLRDRVLLLARVLGAMPPHEADEVVDLALGRALSSRSQTRRRRREALKAIAALYAPPHDTKTAAAIELDLIVYERMHWQQDREHGPPLGDTRRGALCAFMLENNGAILRRTSIWLELRGATFDSEKSPDF